MVKNRKPLFVSESALRRLGELAQEKKCFRGDVVDMLLGIKSEADISHEFKEKEHFAKRVGRVVDEGEVVVG